MTATYRQANYLETLWGKLTVEERIALGVKDLCCFDNHGGVLVSSREASRLIGKLKDHIDNDNLYAAPSMAR